MEGKQHRPIVNHPSVRIPLRMTTNDDKGNMDSDSGNNNDNNSGSGGGGGGGEEDKGGDTQTTII